MSYSKVVEFCESYNQPIPSRFEYIFKMTQLNILFNKKYSIGLRLWLFTGSMTGWLKTFLIDDRENMKKVKQKLEDAFTPELRKMLEDKFNE